MNVDERLSGVARASLVATLAALGTACSAKSAAPPPPGPIPLITPDFAPAAGTFCALPGSVVQTAKGPELVPDGDAGTPDLGWLHLPVGFCAHAFGSVHNARQLKFAPGGELFVASPHRTTTGGALNGLLSIMVLPDDDHDGVADQAITFLSGLDGVQGLMFQNGFFYYQDSAVIRRLPYSSGDRAPTGSADVATDMSSLSQDSLHWPKVMDRAMDGTIYVTNGGSQLDVCDFPMPLRGAIFKLNDDKTTTLVAKGFRNPIAIRCEADHNVCLAIELALDYSASQAGREKLLPIRPGDDWGYPCCATQGVPYAGVTYADGGATPDCANVAAESASFIIGDTPFGLDFETGRWPEPWAGRVFLTLHGAYQTWAGARVVAIAIDPSTGLPLQASELPGASTGDAMLDFATGWDDGRQDHGRPAPIVFAPDGRMFLGNDVSGTIVWVAPVTLAQP